VGGLHAAMVKYCIVVHLPCTAEEYMVLKDDPDYVEYQLGVVGAKELSRVSELHDDGYVTQTIVNRPNVAVPRLLRPLLRGKEIEFRDVRRYENGTQTSVPFVMELRVFNSISDRVTQSARIRIANVEIKKSGAFVEGGDGNSGTDALISDPTVSTPERTAERARLGAVGSTVCEIRCTGEILYALGPFSRAAEELTLKNMRAAYARFPEIVAHWSATRKPGLFGTGGDGKRRENDRGDEYRRDVYCTNEISRAQSPEDRSAPDASSSEGSNHEGSSADDADDDSAGMTFLLGVKTIRRIWRGVVDEVSSFLWRVRGRRVIRIRGGPNTPRRRSETLVVPDDAYLF